MAEQSRTVVYTGWSITGVIAAILSWALNHSVVYAFLHWWLGWIYLLYAALARTEEVDRVITGWLG